jgi:hypothetical protein
MAVYPEVWKMNSSFEILYSSLRAKTESYGIQVRCEPLGLETPGKFDGLSITLNSDYDLESCCYYLVHSLGSIIQWSLDPQGSQRVFDELRKAKVNKSSDPVRFTQALERFCSFEEVSSEYAVWILKDIGHDWAIPSYTDFFRADMEAMIQYHRSGRAPVWREFFAEWKEQVAQGEKQVRPFRPRPVPQFRPVFIQMQEVLQ